MALRRRMGYLCIAFVTALRGGGLLFAAVLLTFRAKQRRGVHILERKINALTYQLASAQAPCAAYSVNAYKLFAVNSYCYGFLCAPLRDKIDQGSHLLLRSYNIWHKNSAFGSKIT